MATRFAENSTWISSKSRHVAHGFARGGFGIWQIGGGRGVTAAQTHHRNGAKRHRTRHEGAGMAGRAPAQKRASRTATVPRAAGYWLSW